MTAQRLILITLSAFLVHTVALVEFRHSKLFDETDFAQAVHIANFCDVGCRLYVSVPDSSAEIAKKIVVHDYINDDDPRKNLYDISLKTHFGEKGYYLVEIGNAQVNLLNTNKDFATAPLAVWIVRQDAPNFGDAVIYEASKVDSAPSSVDVITVISAEPFTLMTNTSGSTTMISTLTGFDAIDSVNGDDCTRVIEQTNPDAYTDIKIGVRSPLITFVFNHEENSNTTVSIEATVGEDDKFDFRGVSYVTSPGYIGCKESIPSQKTYYSSLYHQNTSIEFSDYNWWYDVTLKSILNTDEEFPVTVTDISNDKGFSSFGTLDKANKDLSIHISWSRNESDFDQFFFVRVIPTVVLVETTTAPNFPTLISTEAAPETTPVPTTTVQRWTTQEPGNQTEESTEATTEPTTEGGRTEPVTLWTVPIVTTTTSGASFIECVTAALSLIPLLLL